MHNISLFVRGVSREFKNSTPLPPSFMLIPPELFLLASLRTDIWFIQWALPRSFKTEWTVSERSEPRWLVVAARGHDRLRRRREQEEPAWQNAWSRSRLGGASACRWWTTAAVMCLSGCWDTAPRSQLETRVGALPWAAVPRLEKGAGFQLPAGCGQLGGKPRGNLVSEVCDKDGQERGREKKIKTRRKESE